MKRNNKGFTMVELLAVVVNLGLLSTIAITGVSRLINKSKTEQLEGQRRTLLMAAESYGQFNKGELPKQIGEAKIIEASTLKTGNYLKEDLVNDKKETCMEKSFVRVYKPNQTDYSYLAYLYCGSDTVPAEVAVPEPTINLYYTDHTGKKDDLSVFNNVKTAKMILDITGGVNGEEQLELISYNYSISGIVSGDEEDNPTLQEVFSSGTIDASGKKSEHLEVKLGDYIDITKYSYFKVVVNAINKQGGIKKLTSDRGATFKDRIPPTCVNIQNQASEDEWINKTSTVKKRTITALCDDGAGSGCIRDTFSRTWPNSKQTTGAEYAYIQVKDNAGNVNLPINYQDATDPCSPEYRTDTCRVIVNVDLSTPTINLDAFAANSDGTKKDNTSILKDDVRKTANDAHETVNIKVNQYKDLVRNWLNLNKTPNGVVYTVEVKDNLHIKEIKWETNAGNIKEESASNYKTVSISNPEGKEIDLDESLTTETNCGVTTYNFTVLLKTEGKRYGKLTVTDKSGNKTVYNIYANIDYTKPTPPSISFYKWANNSTRPTTGTGLAPYTTGTWSSIKVFTKPDGSTDNLSEVYYQYTTTGATTNDTNRTGTYRNIEANGESTIKYRSCDQADNCTDYSTAYSVKVDTQNPTCSSSGGTTWANVAKVTLKGTCSDSVSGCQQHPNNGTSYWDASGHVYRDYTAQGTNVSHQTPGRVYDKAGNSVECPANQTVQIDRTQPINTGITLYGTNNRYAKTSCSDPESGVKNSAPAIEISPLTSHYVNISCENYAGLTSTASRWVEIDWCYSGENTCTYSSCCRGNPYQCVGGYDETVVQKINYYTWSEVTSYYPRFSGTLRNADFGNGIVCSIYCSDHLTGMPHKCQIDPAGTCCVCPYNEVTRTWNSCKSTRNTCVADNCCSGHNTCAYGFR